MAEVWMLWDRDGFEGVYASEDLAEQEADRLRERRGRALTWHATNVWVERRDVLDFPVEGGLRRAELREEVARAVQRWGVRDQGRALHPVQEALVDQYLAVPYQGRLMFPIFQFESRGHLWDGFTDVLAVFRAASWDDRRTFLWFAQEQAALEWRCPAMVLRWKPEAVLVAAEAAVRGT